jgi:hypothetical protein
MKPRDRWIAAGVLLALVGVVLLASGGTAGRAGPGAQPPEYVRSILVEKRSASHALRSVTVLGWAHGSWCWFGDPRAVHLGGRRDETFAGWIGWRGQITIAAYDSRLGFVGAHVVGRLAVDDHGSPSIFVERDGRLTVFWSGHSGPTMNYRTSLRPFDIRRWGRVHRVRSQLRGPKGFTYPNPVMLTAEHDKLYLFWRGGDWSQDYATRTIRGHWSPARRLISVPGERPYVKVDSNGSNTIALAFTNGHPRGVPTSVYYAAYREGALWTAGGQRIASLGSGPISPQQADLVYDARTTGVRAWVWDVALDAAGRPVIVYATFPSPRRHLYWYATWNGQRWVSHLMTLAGPTISPHTIEKDYSGGITLDHRNPSVVFLSRKVRGWFEIERWTTPDRGYSWQYTTVVRTRGADNVRPIVPRGAGGGPIHLLWLHGRYRGYKRYRTSIAFLR